MKKFICILCFILFSFTEVGCSNKIAYENNNSEIIKFIRESDLLDDYGKDNLKIVDTINIEGSTIVGFVCDSAQGVLIYEEDSNKQMSTFSIVDAIGENDIGLSTYDIEYGQNSHSSTKKNGYVVLSSGKSNVSKVELTINDSYTDSKSLKIKTPSMVMFYDDLPKIESNEITTNYRYFDINGFEISI